MKFVVCAIGVAVVVGFGSEYTIKENTGLIWSFKYPPFEMSASRSIMDCLVTCCKHPCCLSAFYDANKCSMFDVFLGQYLTEKEGSTFLKKSLQTGKPTNVVLYYFKATRASILYRNGQL